jgi:hypothetical protein
MRLGFHNSETTAAQIALRPACFALGTGESAATVSGFELFESHFTADHALHIGWADG